MGTALVTDSNGIVTGRYRMKHSYPLTGRFHGIDCVNGQSVEPVTGLAVRQLMATGWEPTDPPTDPASSNATGDDSCPSPALAEAESAEVATREEAAAVFGINGADIVAGAREAVTLVDITPKPDFVADMEAMPVQQPAKKKRSQSAA